MPTGAILPHDEPGAGDRGGAGLATTRLWPAHRAARKEDPRKPSRGERSAAKLWWVAPCSWGGEEVSQEREGRDGRPDFRSPTGAGGGDPARRGIVGGGCGCLPRRERPPQPTVERRGDLRRGARKT